MEDESSTPVEHRKHILWQNPINNQRPKLRMCINDIFIEGLLDVEVDVSIITSKSWHLNWPSRGRCSVPRNWNPISSETKHKMG